MDSLSIHFPVITQLTLNQNEPIISDTTAYQLEKRLPCSIHNISMWLIEGTARQRLFQSKAIYTLCG